MAEAGGGRLVWGQPGAGPADRKGDSSYFGFRTGEQHISPITARLPGPTGQLGVCRH